MVKRQRQIFAHENQYKKNLFQKAGRWYQSLKTWQKGLIIGTIVLIVLLVGIGSYVFSKLNMINRVELSDKKLSCVDVDGYVNILLLGVDTRDMTNIEGAGADAIMILSLKEETGEVKLMSIYRDTYLKMGEQDYYDKITNANRIGGPELMIKSLNQAMDLNISKFAVVNFKAVADLVDAVGGITVNVEDYEIEQLNKYTIQTAKNIGKESYQLVEAAGEQNIEGVQAVSYGRIRKGVGDDYKRTERMRIVLNKVFDKVKTLNVNQLNDLINLMIPQVQTNLSNKDIFSLAARLVDLNIQSGAGWPYDVTGGLLGGVSYVFPNNLYANTAELHEKMFGQEGYEPSAVVLSMSDTIIAQLNAEAERKESMDTRSNSESKEESTETPKEQQKEEQQDTGNSKNTEADRNTESGKDTEADKNTQESEKEESDKAYSKPSDSGQKDQTDTNTETEKDKDTSSESDTGGGQQDGGETPPVQSKPDDESESADGSDPVNGGEESGNSNHSGNVADKKDPNTAK